MIDVLVPALMLLSCTLQQLSCESSFYSKTILWGNILEGSSWMPYRKVGLSHYEFGR